MVGTSYLAVGKVNRTRYLVSVLSEGRNGEGGSVKTVVIMGRTGVSALGMTTSGIVDSSFDRKTDVV